MMLGVCLIGISSAIFYTKMIGYLGGSGWKCTHDQAKRLCNYDENASTSEYNVYNTEELCNRAR